MDFQILGLLRVEIARMNAVRLLGSLALLVAGSAWAEGNCPQGYYPIGGGNGGWAGCAPIPNDNAPAPDPGPQWERRWGAIAVDETVGRFGGAEGYSSALDAPKKRPSLHAGKTAAASGARRWAVRTTTNAVRWHGATNA